MWAFLARSARNGRSAVALTVAGPHRHVQLPSIMLLMPHKLSTAGEPQRAGVQDIGQHLHAQHDKQDVQELIAEDEQLDLQEESILQEEGFQEGEVARDNAVQQETSHQGIPFHPEAWPQRIKPKRTNGTRKPETERKEGKPREGKLFSRWQHAAPRLRESYRGPAIRGPRRATELAELEDMSEAQLIDYIGREQFLDLGSLCSSVHTALEHICRREGNAPSQEFVKAYFEALARTPKFRPTPRLQSLWAFITDPKLNGFVPDLETVRILSKDPHSIGFNERNLADIIARVESSIEELGLREFASLFRMSKNLGTANLTSRLLQLLTRSNLMESVTADDETYTGFIANAVFDAAAQQKNPNIALRMLEEAKTLSPTSQIGLLVLQGILQRSIEKGDVDAVERALEKLHEAIAESDNELCLPEGLCLSLLCFGVSKFDEDITQAAWLIYQRAIQGSATNDKVRKPISEGYQTYIHGLSAFCKFDEAFSVIAELQATHPRSPVRWYAELRSLVDCLAGHKKQVLAAQEIIENRLEQGEPVTTAMTDCILAAAGQINEIELAFTLFDRFADLRPPTTDSYAAIINGCVSCRSLEAVPLIVKEMADKQLPVNRQLLSSFVKFFVVARHPQGILDTLNDMRTRGMYPSSNLLEMALRRLEREGHRSGITQVHIEIGRRNWRSYSAERMRVRWRNLGGMKALTGSKTFVSRPDPLKLNPQPGPLQAKEQELAGNA